MFPTRIEYNAPASGRNRLSKESSFPKKNTKGPQQPHPPIVMSEKTNPQRQRSRNGLPMHMSSRDIRKRKYHKTSGLLKRKFLTVQHNDDKDASSALAQCVVHRNGPQDIEVVGNESLIDMSQNTSRRIRRRLRSNNSKEGKLHPTLGRPEVPDIQRTNNKMHSKNRRKQIPNKKNHYRDNPGQGNNARNTKRCGGSTANGHGTRNSRRTTNLAVEVFDRSQENSYDVTVNTFRKGGLSITKAGSYLSTSSFAIKPNELELKGKIGQGCSSVVTLALHKKSGQYLAVKRINYYQKDRRAQLVKEIKTLYNCGGQCPCIVKFFGAFFCEGWINIVLEYMDGGSMQNFLHQIGSPTEEILATIMYQVLHGLAYLHMERRIHRDVKPSNILLNSNGHVKLTDFGVTAHVQEKSMCNTYVGTFKYMSPERITSQPYSYMSDIWSAGITMVEIATGSYPYTFPPQTPIIDYVNAIVVNKPPELPTYSPQGQFFVQSCLHKTPTKRLPAQVLLGCDWFSLHEIIDLESARSKLSAWIQL